MVSCWRNSGNGVVEFEFPAKLLERPVYKAVCDDVKKVARTLLFEYCVVKKGEFILVYRIE